MTTALESTPLRCWRSEDGIVSLQLESPERPVVILDQELLGRLDATLDVIIEASADEPITGFILGSACPRVFVAGADLKEIDGLDDPSLLAYLAEGNRIFSKIVNLPCPTVAAIDGATLGGGLEIAMHCDALVATRTSPSGKPYPIGLPECSLGICPGWGGTQMLPARIDPFTALQMTIEGVPAMSTELPGGLIDHFVDEHDQLEAACCDWIHSNPRVDRGPGTPHCIDRKHPGTMQAAVERARTEVEETPMARVVLGAVEAGLRSGWAAGLQMEQESLVELRNTEATRDKLAAFFQKQG